MNIRPIRANIEITDSCNLKCLHCYFYFENNDQKNNSDKLGLPDLKKLIKKLQREGVMEFSIGGGEPFCFSKIEEILLLSTKRCFTYVSTNGLLLNDKRINFLKKLPNFLLQISLDGRDETHKKIRNINDDKLISLKKIIKKCVKAKIDLQIGFMLCHINVNDIHYICKFCIAHHIKNLNILPYIGENKDFQLSKNDFKKSAITLRRYIKKLLINIRDPFLSFLVFKKEKYCEAGKLTFNIDPYGNVSPCCYLRHLNLDNIFKLKIEEIPLICEQNFSKEFKNWKRCVALDI